MTVTVIVTVTMTMTVTLTVVTLTMTRTVIVITRMAVKVIPATRAEPETATRCAGVRIPSITAIASITWPPTRATKLHEWLALPRHVYTALADGRRVYATFDERQRGSDRLSSVQYLKFATGGETPAALGSDLPGLAVEVLLTKEQRAALTLDLAS